MSSFRDFLWNFYELLATSQVQIKQVPQFFRGLKLFWPAQKNSSFRLLIFLDARPLPLDCTLLLSGLVLLLCHIQKIKYKKTITRISLASLSISHNARYLSARSLSAYCIFVLLISILRPSSILRYMLWWIVYLFVDYISAPVCFVFSLWRGW